MLKQVLLLMLILAEVNVSAQHASEKRIYTERAYFNKWKDTNAHHVWYADTSTQPFLVKTYTEYHTPDGHIQISEQQEEGYARLVSLKDFRITPTANKLVEQFLNTEPAKFITDIGFAVFSPGRWLLEVGTWRSPGRQGKWETDMVFKDTLPIELCVDDYYDVGYKTDKDGTSKYIVTKRDGFGGIPVRTE